MTIMTDWLLIIFDPHNLLRILQAELYLFQIFAVVAYDYLWFVWKIKLIIKVYLVPNGLCHIFYY
jgi:hypothetical protein